MTASERGGLLATIVAATRRIIQVREQAVPAELITWTRQPCGPAFAEALRVPPAPRVIAECKRRSPSRGVLRSEYHPAAHAAAYARAGAVAISVLTEPTFFDGDLEHLFEVRCAVTLPLLRKDFIVSDYQLLEASAAGADAVLLIVAALDDAGLRRLFSRAQALGLAALVEVHDEAELRRALDAGATIVGVNSRDLRTLSMDPKVHERLAAAIPAGVTAVAESGIGGSADLARLARLGYHAFLIGERLISQPDPGAALEELRAHCQQHGAGSQAPAECGERSGAQGPPPVKR